MHTNPPKNKKVRTVRMGQALTQELKDLANTLKPHPRFTPERYVFGPGEKPLRYSADFYLKYWKAAVKAAGLPPELRFHDLRHTCASLLIRQGVPPLQVKEHLGHSSITITLDLYSHLYEDTKDQVGDAIDAAFK